MHLPAARRILEDGRLRGGLIYDESRLRKSRICVTWLSANTWGLGSIYGNVQFAFPWKRQIRKRHCYWVEVMTGYRPRAYRILLSDRDLSESKYVREYDPASNRGPLRERGGAWYWNNQFTSEFMVEADIDLDQCTGFDFISHHHSSRAARFRQEGVRKLFQENRQSFIEALMHRFVLVPEGRTDAEWLRLFSLCAVSEELGECADSLPFGTVFGIAPTHDACVVDTVEKIMDIRSGVVVLVDGNAAGDDYVKTLLKAAKPPEHVVQWPSGSEIEDVVGWVLGSETGLVQTIQAEISTAPATLPEIVAWLKKPTKEKGAKTDLLAYEAVTTGILMSAKAKSRARSLLAAFVDMTFGKPSSKLLQADKARSNGKTSVWRLALEP